MYATSNRQQYHHPARPSVSSSRNRSSSDPFSDPVYPAPHVAYTSSYPDRAPPPPPPKPHHARKPSKQHDYRDRDRDPRMEPAVKESVNRPSKVGRSQTQTTGPVFSSSRQPAPATRRSYSQDSGTPPQNMKSSRSRPGKKGSTHADAIDKMDLSGMGPMFHHDGPFDACAPSRNRHKAKAPMAAWTAPEDDLPMSAAQLRATRRRMPDEMGDSPYDVALGDGDYYGHKSSKQVDRIAEAWGIHEPEPYEEFFGGGGGGGGGGNGSAANSMIGGYEGHNGNQHNGHSRGSQLRETYTTENPPVRKATGRLPPPKPLNLPGASRPASLDAPATSMPSPPLTGSPGAPKRSKSLMQKFKKMRDQPNVPVDAATPYADGNPSPTSSSENYANEMYSDGGGRTGRPTHRHQNSFFGRLAGRTLSANPGPVSPAGDVDNHYVYVEGKKSRGKALPPRPKETPISPSYGNDKDGYFDGATTAAGSLPSSPNGGGIARKTSILKKVKGAVRGGK